MCMLRRPRKDCTCTYVANWCAGVCMDTSVGCGWWNHADSIRGKVDGWMLVGPLPTTRETRYTLLATCVRSGPTFVCVIGCVGKLQVQLAPHCTSCIAQGFFQPTCLNDCGCCKSLLGGVVGGWAFAGAHHITANLSTTRHTMHVPSRIRHTQLTGPAADACDNPVHSSVRQTRMRVHHYQKRITTPSPLAHEHHKSSATPTASASLPTAPRPAWRRTCSSSARPCRRRSAPPCRPCPSSCTACPACPPSSRHHRRRPRRCP